VFETVLIQIPDAQIGSIAESVPGQAIAQLSMLGFIDGDVLAEESGSECRQPFRMVRPEYPVCLVTPDPVEPGRQVTVEASGLFEDEPVGVLVGDLMVGEGMTDGQGNVSIDFNIPLDSPAVPRLVTVGNAGTSLTADCAVEVLPGDADLVEQRLVGVVFDTGEFVGIDTDTGQGTLIGLSEAINGLTHRGAQLFGVPFHDRLLQLDRASGATIDSWAPGYGPGIEGAVAFRRDGVGFVVRGGAPSQLWRFGAIDGGAVPLSPNLAERLDGLAFDSEDRLFGLGESGVLYQIDTEDGFVEPVGTTDIPLNTTAGMTFDPDDKLYLAVSDKLYTVETTTALATLIGPIGFGSVVPGRDRRRPGGSGVGDDLRAAGRRRSAPSPPVMLHCRSAVGERPPALL
jgi:hypothetical protein